MSKSFGVPKGRKARPSNLPKKPPNKPDKGRDSKGNNEK